MCSAPLDLTVGELIKKCSERPRNEVAWEEFIRRYHTTIKSFVIRTYHQKARVDPDRINPEDMIEDLVQDVYRKLVEDQNSALKIFEGEHENSIFKYLGMISMNVVRDHFRKETARKRPRVTDSLDHLLTRGDPPVPAVDPDPPFAVDDIEQALRKVVKGKNRERDILIFKLKIYDELTFNEIKDALGLDLSPVSIGSILNRIVRKMKRILASSRGIRL